MVNDLFVNEIWRPVKGFEGLYEVSNQERLKSLERYDTYTTKRGTIVNRYHKEKIVSTGKGNYLHFTFCKNGEHTTIDMQVIVAKAFPDICGEPFEGAEVDHRNDNPYDNRPENLHWLSHIDNCNKEHHKEAISKSIMGIGCKPVIQYTKDGEFVREWASAAEIARVLGYSSSNISLCCNNRVKYRYGYRWQFKNQIVEPS